MKYITELGTDATRVGGSIGTFAGNRVYPLDADPDTIDIKDIAHALSNQCRFSGHVKKFYSVAEHSVRVSELLKNSFTSTELALAGLMHDSTEAYLVDLPRPIKHTAGFGDMYRDAEDRLYVVIARKYGLPIPIPQKVHEADNIMLATELRDLMGVNVLWDGAPSPNDTVIKPWSPEVAEKRFLDLYNSLTYRS